MYYNFQIVKEPLCCEKEVEEAERLIQLYKSTSDANVLKEIHSKFHVNYNWWQPTICIQTKVNLAAEYGRNIALETMRRYYKTKQV